MTMAQEIVVVSVIEALRDACRQLQVRPGGEREAIAMAYANTRAALDLLQQLSISASTAAEGEK